MNNRRFPQLPPASGGGAVGFPRPQQPQRQPQPAPRPYAPPQGMGGAPYVDPNALGGDPGYITAAQLRRALAPYDQKIGELMQRVEQGDAQLGDVLRFQDQRGLDGIRPPGFDALGENVKSAIYTGRCLPYNAVLEVFVPAGTAGTQLSQQIFVTQDGPIFISRVLGYAQIDSRDTKAKNFPATLIDAPPCVEGNDPLALNDTGIFTLNPAALLPQIDMSGRFIPLSPRNCRLIPLGTESICGTLTCDELPDRKFNVRQPLVVFDQAECFDGLVQISTNDCGWQSSPYPIAMLEDAMFDLTNESPDCIGVCGFVDCNKVLQTIITPTRPLRYDVVLQVVFAGFRVLTCGGPACSS